MSRIEINKNKIKAEYESEKMIHQRFFNSDQEERKRLYLELYNNHFSKFPKAFQSFEDADKEIGVISRFLNKNKLMLEIGTGDGHFAKEVYKHVEKLTTLDVAEKSNQALEEIPEIKQLQFNGLEADLPADHFDIAYSNQIFEHLHPDDAGAHLKIARKALKPGGKYIIITPHRYCGPHDLSRHFDREARGLHLREYTYQEIYKIAKNNNFSKCEIYIQRNRYSLRVCRQMIFCFEKFLNILPYRIRKVLSRALLPSIMVVLKK